MLILQTVKMCLLHFTFLPRRNCFVTSGRLDILEADARDGCDLANHSHKWPCAVNYVNLAERRFRSFSTLTNTTDMDPVKHKKKLM